MEHYVERDPPLVLLAVTLLFASGSVACGEPDSEEGSAVEETETVQQAVSTCTPRSGFDTCYETSWDGLEYWQDTLPDPDWREVEPSSAPDVDYEVRIVVKDLNAGVIPTRSGQGEYNSWGDYYRTMENLVGVDVTEYTVSVAVEGVPMKVDKSNYPVPFQDDPGSTGEFLHDALTDEDGRIYIDNVDKTDDLIPEEALQHYEVLVDDQPVTGSENYTSHSIDDETVLEDGPWTADFTLDHYIHQSGTIVTGSINNVTYNATYRCIFTYDSGTAEVQRHCPITEADGLMIHNAVEADGQWDLTDPRESTDDASSFSHSYLNQVPENDSCSFGRADFDYVEDYEDSDMLKTQYVDPTDCDGFFGN